MRSWWAAYQQCRWMSAASASRRYCLKFVFNYFSTCLLSPRNEQTTVVLIYSDCLYHGDGEGGTIAFAFLSYCSVNLVLYLSIGMYYCWVCFYCFFFFGQMGYYFSILFPLFFLLAATRSFFDFVFWFCAPCFQRDMSWLLCESLLFLNLPCLLLSPPQKKKKSKKRIVCCVVSLFVCFLSLLVFFFFFFIILIITHFYLPLAASSALLLCANHCFCKLQNKRRRTNSTKGSYSQTPPESTFPPSHWKLMHSAHLHVGVLGHCASQENKEARRRGEQLAVVASVFQCLSIRSKKNALPSLALNAAWQNALRSFLWISTHILWGQRLFHQLSHVECECVFPPRSLTQSMLLFTIVFFFFAQTFRLFPSLFFSPPHHFWRPTIFCVVCVSRGFVFYKGRTLQAHALPSPNASLYFKNKNKINNIK